MISICIASYKRPDQLKNLLRVLTQEIERPTAIEIVVCDNDSNQTAQAVVLEAAKQSDIPVRYYCEPIQNISLARNCTIKQAKGEWIAFIDDDEIPSISWLANLFSTIQNYNVDGVSGPVKPKLPPNCPDWIRKGGFFAELYIPTGKELRLNQTACGNLLVKSSIFTHIKEPFDYRFGRSGGEDSLLFGILIEKYKYRFIACEAAEVFEYVSPARCNTNWLVRRAYRGGQTWIRVIRLIRGRNSASYFRAPFVLVALSPALLITPFIFLIKRHWGVKIIQIFARLIGQISANFSAHYIEYR